MITLSNYVSYMCSSFHSDFVELGYPELDVVEFDDGEWNIVQYFNSPVIPCLTKWQPVLTKLRHVDKNPSVFSRYCNQLDLEKRYLWEEMERKEREAAQQEERKARHAEDIATRQHQAIIQTPDLMDRIARNGLQEINLRKISRNISNHHFR